MPIDCDDEYWDHPDPELAFERPTELPGPLPWECQDNGQNDKSDFRGSEMEMGLALGLNNIVVVSWNLDFQIKR